MKKKIDGIWYDVEKVYLVCVGGCGREIGPIYIEKGTKIEFECLRCKIKRS